MSGGDYAKRYWPRYKAQLIALCPLLQYNRVANYDSLWPANPSINARYIKAGIASGHFGDPERYSLASVCSGRSP